MFSGVPGRRVNCAADIYSFGIVALEVTSIVEIFSVILVTPSKSNKIVPMSIVFDLLILPCVI